MQERIYLDNAATTPIDPRVLEAMLPYLTEHFANPSSVHQPGQHARGAVDDARVAISRCIGARSSEIIFTSGGTESNNLAIRGFAEANAAHGRHIVTCNIEHPAVREAIEDLVSRGFEVSVVPVTPDGVVRAEDIISAIRNDTILVSLMLVNNEIGTIQPVAEVGAFVRGLAATGRKIALHTDAVQAVGKIPVDVENLGCDLLSLSGHKIHAPKGIGALYVRKGVRITKQNLGGGQESKLRGGTENVAGIVALGKAAELASDSLESALKDVTELRDLFERSMRSICPRALFNGSGAARVPYISNITFPDSEAEQILIGLDMRGVSVSTGSACSSGSISASPVILALGHRAETARGAIRFSFSRLNETDDLDPIVGFFKNLEYGASDSN